jgi:hypothetical protein
VPRPRVLRGEHDVPLQRGVDRQERLALLRRLRLLGAYAPDAGGGLVCEIGRLRAGTLPSTLSGWHAVLRAGSRSNGLGVVCSRAEGLSGADGGGLVSCSLIGWFASSSLPLLHLLTRVCEWSLARAKTPRLAEQIMWSLTLAASMLLAFKAIKGAMNQVPAYLARKKKLQAKGTTLHPWEFTPLLIVMLTIVMLWMPMTYSTMKIVGVEDREFGRAWLPSTLFVLVSTLGFTTNIVSELSSFDLVTQGSGLSKDDRAKLRFYIKSRSIVTVVGYCGSTALVMSIGCSMPRTNPTVNVMRWLLIVRNLSFSIMTINIYLVNRTVRNQIDKLVKKMGAGSTANSASTAAATHALEFMKHLAKEKAVSCLVGSLLMIIWCFPMMRPHQGYVMSALTTLLFVKSHPIDSTLKASSSSSKVTDASGSAATSATGSSHE